MQETTVKVLLLFSGDFNSVYFARYELASFFLDTKDKWLSDHFFKTCLDTAENIDNDEGKTKAEGHCNVGIAVEENGWSLFISIQNIFFCFNNDI